MVFLVFGVLLVPSLFLLAHFFLLVLGLGFGGGGEGGSSYFWDLGGFPGVLGSFGFFLFLSCFFLFLSSSGCSGWFSWGLGFFWFLSLVPLLFLLVPFLLLGVLGGCSWGLGVSFLSLSGRLPVRVSSCFGGPGWSSPGVWGSYCSFLVCYSCSCSSCFGGPGWFSWGFGVLLCSFLVCSSCSCSSYWFWV